MSIKSIDTQIMIQRTMDTVRDASVIHKQPQTFQENLAAKNIADSAIEKTTVKELEQTEMQGIRTDVEGEGSGLGGGGGAEGEEEEAAAEEVDEIPPAAVDYNRFIDIVI